MKERKCDGEWQCKWWRGMKVKKTDYGKVDVVKQEVYSRDEEMHVGMSGVQLSTRNWLEDEKEWQETKYEYSEEVGERSGYAGKRAAWLWEYTWESLPWRIATRLVAKMTRRSTVVDLMTLDLTWLDKGKVTWVDLKRLRLQRNVIDWCECCVAAWMALRRSSWDFLFF